MPLPKREQLAEYYRKRFAYIANKYPAFNPSAITAHLSVIRTSDMLWRVLKKRLRKFDLTPPALATLLMLDSAENDMTMTEISRELAVTQANITGIVDTLEKRGLVRRSPHPEDRRVFKISITASGVKTVEQVAPEHFKLIHSLYEDLDEKESAAMTNALEKIRARLLPLLGCALLAWAAPAPLRASTWTVRESVQSALNLHPAVAEARQGVDAALSAQLRLLGAYDPSLAASLRRLDAKTPPTFIFQTARTVTDSSSLGLTKRFDLGTTAGIATSYSKEKDDVTSAFSSNPRHRTGLDLSVSQPLLKGLIGTPERAALRASGHALLAARATLARAAETTAAQVGGAYWQLWRARKAISVFEKSAEEAREFLETTRRLRTRYEAERDDLLRAEADLLAKELEILDARESAEERAAELVEMTGVDRDILSEAVLESPAEPEILQASLAQALLSRSDLAAAKAMSSRDAENLEAAEAGFGLPALAMSGAFGWAGLKTNASDSMDQLTGFGFRTWSIGLDLSYAFGRRTDKAQRTDARAMKLLSDTRAAALQRRIRRELETATRRLTVALERVRVTRNLQTMQEEVLSLSQKKYSQGRIESRDRLRDANAALGARSARLAAHAEYAQRRLETRAAEGTLLKHLEVSP